MLYDLDLPAILYFKQNIELGLLLGLSTFITTLDTMIQFKVHLRWHEYRNFTFFQLIQQPVSLFTLLVGLLFLGVGIFLSTQGQQFSGSSLIILGIILILFLPISTYFKLKRTWSGLTPLRSAMNYQINQQRMRVYGKGFEMEKELDKVFKVVEKQDFFLIYLKANSASMIPKRCLSADQLEMFRNVFNLG